MTGPYAGYIVAAYGVCFGVLAVLVAMTCVSWRRVQRELGE